MESFVAWKRGLQVVARSCRIAISSGGGTFEPVAGKQNEVKPVDSMVTAGWGDGYRDNRPCGDSKK